MSEGRTTKASRNVLIGFISKAVIMVFALATKTLFIRLLGVEYNGISGLFSNILAILALSELGAGNVMNFALYQALKKDDKEKIRSLVAFFKRIYCFIALTIVLVGLAFFPFLKYIINSDLPMSELQIYYLLYLANSVSSYFMCYKTTVVTADQKNYINSLCEIAATVILYLMQIAYLLIRKDFLGYLTIQIFCTLLKNIFLNHITNRQYPYLKQLDPKNNALSQNEKQALFDNIRSTFLYKIAAVILNNTDSILISILVGTVFVGYYSNYYLIISYITSFISIFITGITASLGNLNSENNKEATFQMFKILSLIFSFIGTIVVCCLFNCFQPFILLWIGQENVMHFSWVIVITLNFFLSTIMNPVWMFRETMGLFKQVRFILLIAAGLNIVFSVVLGMLLGVPGVLAATFIARLCSQYWYEPLILFRKFQQPVRRFYLNQFRQLVVLSAALILSAALCSFFGNSIGSILLRGIVSTIIAACAVWVTNYKSEAMSLLKNRYIYPLLKKQIDKP